MTDLASDKASDQAPVLAGILETALYAPDLDAAKRFYGEVLGLPLATEAEGRHAFFRCGEGMLLLFAPDATLAPPPNPALPVPAHGARGPGHMCFRADGPGLDAIRARLEACGVAIEQDFHWPGGARSVYCRDPAGNSVEFAEPKLWGFDA